MTSAATSMLRTATGTTHSGKTSPPHSVSMRRTRQKESQPRLSITVTNRQVANPVIMSYHVQAAVVRDNHELLGANAGRSTRHLEVVLPSGVAYKAGDHLGVLPRNNINIIRRVMLHFGLDAGST